MRLLYIFLLHIVVLSGNAKENNTSSLIIQPLNKARYIGESSTFVFDTVGKEIDTIVIRQENNISSTLEINKTKPTYCKTIQLNLGNNIINVESYKEGTLVSKERRDVYFLSELFEGLNEEDAEDYQLSFFHKNEKEEKCKACHNMTSNVPTNGKAFEDITQTTCYECHKGMMNTRNTHAPVANWLCLDCHNGQIAEYNRDKEGQSKYLAPDPISKTCTSCHETVEEWTNSKYTHGPVNDGRCERCHNPHGSNNEFFLRKNIWELCVTCHAEKATGKHIVSSFVFSRNEGAHPTKSAQDPSRPEREFTCSSCHNPHGSSGIFLLRMKGSVPFNVCSRCHKK